jgi:hypothetical protein
MNLPIDVGNMEAVDLDDLQNIRGTKRIIKANDDDIMSAIS